MSVSITAGAVSLQTGKFPGRRLELVVVAMREDSTRKRLGSLLDTIRRPRGRPRLKSKPYTVPRG